MNWITLILLLVRIGYYAIRYAPEIASLMKSIIDLIRGIDNQSTQAAFAVELDAAFKDYKATKDDTRLRDLLANVLRHCKNEKTVNENR